MKIYLAAAYGRREEILELSKLVTAAGHEVTSRWLTGQHETPPEGIAEDSSEHWRWCAEDDLADIEAADSVISFTGGGNRSRGGRHVEFGIAVALGKGLAIVGDRENVFHDLDGVERFDTLEEALQALTH